MKKPFNDRPVEEIAPEMLKGDGTILDIRLKYIGDEGLKFIANDERFANLKELNLERNDISVQGIKYLNVWT